MSVANRDSLSGLDSPSLPGCRLGEKQHRADRQTERRGV